MMEKIKALWQKKGARIAIIVSASVLLLAIILGAVALIMANGARDADGDALAEFEKKYGLITPEEKDGYAVYHYSTESDGMKRGFIFYPDSMTSARAYAPLMTLMAKKGITCYVVEPMLNQPAMSVSDAEKIVNENPEVEEWYLGGHGKGGTAAAEAAARDSERYSGLILFAAYSKVDLSDTALRAYTLYGSEDGITDIDALIDAREKLPEGSEDYEIVGCNYSGFAMYGVVSGDGKATVENARQVMIAAQRAASFILD